MVLLLTVLAVGDGLNPWVHVLSILQITKAMGFHLHPCAVNKGESDFTGFSNNKLKVWAQDNPCTSRGKSSLQICNFFEDTDTGIQLKAISKMKG